MELNQQRIEDGIIAEVASKMVRDDDLYTSVKRTIEARIDQLWKQSVEARIGAEVEASIAKGFEREYQKVDSYGVARGERTTISKELEKLIGGYWNEKVGKDGKPTSGYGEKLTRAEWLMTKMCADDFQGAMKQHVVNVTATLKDRFRLELHETVNRLLSDFFNVKSLDDQGKGRTDRSVIHPPAQPAA